MLQFLTELPDFIILVVSAVFSGSLIVFMDLLDSLGYMFRNATVFLISKKLSKNLKYEYNYGSGKIEALTALFCDGILFFGFLMIIMLSVSEFFTASKPSEMLIFVVGFKLYDMICDIIFFKKQRNILKTQNNAIAQNGYASAMSALLFDGVTCASLLIIWLLRNHPTSTYIAPALSILIAIWMIIGCLKRMSSALGILTDKSLPEDMQMKILRALSPCFDRYSMFHSINSHNVGDHLKIDIVLSFKSGTTVDEVIDFKATVQNKISEMMENAVVNIIVM